MEYRNTQIPISKATKLVHLVLLLRCFCFRSFAATAAAAAAATIAALLALISLLCVCVLRFVVGVAFFSVLRNLRAVLFPPFRLFLIHGHTDAIYIPQLKVGHT